MPLMEHAQGNADLHSLKWVSHTIEETTLDVSLIVQMKIRYIS